MKSIIKTKKSQAHVEMILSFIIFVGFVTVMLILLNPIKQTRISTTALDVTEKELVNSLSIDYDVITLFIKEGSNQGSCFEIDKDLIRSNKENIIVKDINENLVESYHDTTTIYIDNASSNFYRIYLSDFFNDSSGSLTNCEEFDLNSNYSFGVLTNQERVSLERIQNLTDEYARDYSSLKDSMNLANDFEFYVYQGNDLIYNGSINNPPGINIVARDIPILAINEEAKIIDLRVNIRAW